MSGPSEADQRVLEIAGDNPHNTLRDDGPPSPPKDARPPRSPSSEVPEDAKVWKTYTADPVVTVMTTEDLKGYAWQADPQPDAGKWPAAPPAPPSADEQLQAIRNICEDVGVFTEEQMKETRKALAALDRKIDMQHGTVVRQLDREAGRRQTVGLSDDIHASLSPATFTAFARLHQAIAALTKELRAERAQIGLVAGWLQGWDLCLAEVWQGFKLRLPWRREEPFRQTMLRMPSRKPL